MGRKVQFDTPEKIARLRHLWETGVSIVALRKEFKCGHPTLIAVIKALGLPMERSVKKPVFDNLPMQNRLRALWDAGNTCHQIGEIMGIPQKSVRSAVERLGISKLNPHIRRFRVHKLPPDFRPPLTAGKALTEEEQRELRRKLA